MNIRLSRRWRIQTRRTEFLIGFRRWFNAEWCPDQISDEVMVASLTLFGVSIVYLGTAA